jgi:hypothetical protein
MLYYSGSLYNQTNVSTADQKYACTNHSEMTKACQLYWTRKISNQMHMGIISMLAFAPQPQQAVHYLWPAVNIIYETSCLFERVTLF